MDNTEHKTDLTNQVDLRNKLGGNRKARRKKKFKKPVMKSGQRHLKGPDEVRRFSIKAGLVMPGW